MTALTRRQLLIALLADRKGWTTRQLAAALEWRPASVRAELSRLRREGWWIIRDGAPNARARRWILPAQAADSDHAMTTATSRTRRRTSSAMQPSLSQLGILE